MAPSTAEVPRPARASLRHGQELEPTPLDLDPRPTVDLAPLQRTFDATLFALEQALTHQAELDKEIEALAVHAPYAEPVGWLRCFRGIDTLSAMILLAEIVDFQRFTHPRELMAYLGLVPSEFPRGTVSAAAPSPKPATPTRGASSWKPLGTIATDPRWAGPWPRAVKVNPRRAALRPGGRNSVCIAATVTRGTRQAPAGRGDGHRPRTRRLPLGRHDATPAGGVGDHHDTSGYALPEWRRGGHDAGTIGGPSR